MPGIGYRKGEQKPARGARVSDWMPIADCRSRVPILGIRLLLTLSRVGRRLLLLTMSRFVGRYLRIDHIAARMRHCPPR